MQRQRLMVLVGCLCAAACLVPPGIRAQDAVRVVETVTEGTGDRRRYVVRDLDEDEIKAVQRALRDQGYVGIGWSGRLDDGTRDGLRRFQERRGLVACACVSYETIVALGLLPEVVATVAAPVGGGDPGSTDVHAGPAWVYPVAIPVGVPRPCGEKGCEGPQPPSPPSGEGEPLPPVDVTAPPGIRPAPPVDARPTLPSDPRMVPPPEPRLERGDSPP